MKIYLNSNVVFVHIPKTAGGSICELLDDQLEPRLVPEGQAHGYLKDNKKYINPTTKIFTSIRNPYDAAVSMYCSHRSTNVMDILGKDSEFNRSLIAPAQNLDFDSWLVDYYEQNRPPYSWYLLVNDKLPEGLRVIKYENLIEDLDRVLNKEFNLNINLNSLPHVHKSERDNKNYLEFFKNRRSIEHINRKYAWTFNMGFYERL